MLEVFWAAVSTKTSCSLSDGGSSGYRSGKSDGVGVGSGLRTLREVLTWDDVARPLLVRVQLVTFTFIVVSAGMALIVETLRTVTTLGIGEVEVEGRDEVARSIRAEGKLTWNEPIMRHGWGCPLIQIFGGLTL